MRKVLWFLFWILLGIGIFCISSIKDSLTCSVDSGNCVMQSHIFNIKISEDSFPISEIQTIKCEKRIQPSKSGKKAYFILKLLKNDNTEYVLGSFKKLQMCKNELKPIKEITNGKSSEISYKSGIGFTNGLGYIFGILMFIIGIITLTNKEEYIEESEDEDYTSEENEYQ